MGNPNNVICVRVYVGVSLSLSIYIYIHIYLLKVVCQSVEINVRTVTGHGTLHSCEVSVNVFGTKCPGKNKGVREICKFPRGARNSEDNSA